MSTLPTRPNESFFDRFSVPHAAGGALFQLSGFSAPVAFAAQVGFELVENDLKRTFNPLFPDDSPDAWQNHVGDVVAWMGGYYFAQAVRNDAVGRAALIGLGAVAAAIWFDNLTSRPPKRAF